jgi:hypothetical protein
MSCLGQPIHNDTYGIVPLGGVLGNPTMNSMLTSSHFHDGMESGCKVPKSLLS